MSFFDEIKELRAARLSQKAAEALKNGDLQKCEALYRKSLALMEAGDYGALQTAVHVAGLAGALEAQGRVQECLPLAERAITMVEAISSDEYLVAGILTGMLSFHLNHQRFDDAASILRRVVGALEQLTDPAVIAGATGQVADSLLGPVFRNHDDPDRGKKLKEAERLYRRALDVQGGIPELDPLERFLLLDQLGSTLALADHFDDAERVHYEALDLLEENVERDHPAYVQAFASLADMFLLRQDYGSAEGFLKKALVVGEHVPGLKTHPELLGIAERLADTLRHLDRGDEAEELESARMKPQPEPRGPTRGLLALAGYLLLFLTLPIGLPISFLIIPHLPSGSLFGQIAVIVPTVPLVAVAWLFLKASGRTESQDVSRAAIAALVLGAIAAAFLYWILFR